MQNLFRKHDRRRHRYYIITLYDGEVSEIRVIAEKYDADAYFKERKELLDEDHEMVQIFQSDSLSTLIRNFPRWFTPELIEIIDIPEEDIGPEEHVEEETEKEGFPSWAMQK